MSEAGVSRIMGDRRNLYEPWDSDQRDVVGHQPNLVRINL